MVKHQHIRSTFLGWLSADSYCLFCQVVWSLRGCSDRVVRECDVKGQGPDDIGEVSSWRWRTDYWRTGLRVSGWGWWRWGRRALASRRGRQYGSSGPSLSLVTHAAAAASTAPALSAPLAHFRVLGVACLSTQPRPGSSYIYPSTGILTLRLRRRSEFHKHPRQ